MLPIEILDEDGRLLFARAWATQNSFERVQGWLGREAVAEDEGLLIRPCASVHSFGMRFRFDVAFLDRDGRILSIRPRVGPARLAWAPIWRLLCPWRVMALELPAGAAEAHGLHVGRRLVVRERGR
jgi:uncharacterized membrane protein (UPF0127 family)